MFLKGTNVHIVLLRYRIHSVLTITWSYVHLNRLSYYKWTSSCSCCTASGQNKYLMHNSLKKKRKKKETGPEERIACVGGLNNLMSCEDVSGSHIITGKGEQKLVLGVAPESLSCLACSPRGETVHVPRLLQEGIRFLFYLTPSVFDSMYGKKLNLAEMLKRTGRRRSLEHCTE